MKKIASNYSFDASERQITLGGLVLPHERLLLIVNASRNQIIYNLTGSGYASQTIGTTVSHSSSDTIITLAFDTTGFSDSDKLAIFYDDGSSEGSGALSMDSIDGETPAPWLKLGGGAVPVDVQGATLNIGGNVTVSNEVEIKNDSGHSVPVLETVYRPVAELEWEVPANSPVIDVSGYPAGTVFAINIKPQANTNSTHKLQSNGSNSQYGWLDEEVTTAFTASTLTTLTTQGLYIWRKRDALSAQNHIKFVSVSAGGGGIARAKIFAVSNPYFGLPTPVSIIQNSLPLPVTGPLTDSQLRASALETRASGGTLATLTGIAPEDSTVVLAASQTRRYLLLQNLSTAPFHINFTNPASLSTLRIDGGAAMVFEGNFIPHNPVTMVRTAPNQSYFLAYLH